MTGAASLTEIRVIRQCLEIAFETEKRDFFLEGMFGNRSKLVKFVKVES